MILKNFELNKLDADKFNLLLLHGKNEGFQNDIIENYFLKNFVGEINKYDENNFINLTDVIISELLNKSLFEEKKIIIVSRVTDKLFKYVVELIEKEIGDIKIIFKAGLLEKKSKLRNLFEKNKKLISIPFYEDDSNVLTSLIVEFLNKNKIKLSRESINLIVERSSGDRQNVKMELEKILQYSFSNKKIDYEIVSKLTNLSENYSVNILVDSYLSKNKKSLFKILNENNYSNEDCILILRSILGKSKKLLNLIEKYNETQNLENVISAAKPPIFWKDKDNVKKQIVSWKIDELKNKIYEINDIETIIKINSKNSLNLLSNFIVNYQ